MVLFDQFTLRDGSVCELVYPEKAQAADLYAIIEAERDRLAAWFPWPRDMHSVQDEEAFIEFALGKMEKQEMLMLTIVIAGKAVGMVDFHNINHADKTAEVGYWLSEYYEGLGIITQAVKKLVEHGLTTMGLEKIYILVDEENQRSAGIPLRLGFKKEAHIKDFVVLNDQSRNFDKYVLSLEKWE